MKKTVTQMIGCLNVLSRLKNPDICINSADTQQIMGLEFQQKGGTSEQGSATSRYYHRLTHLFPLLLNFDQFG